MVNSSISLRFIRFIISFMFSSAVFLCSLSAQTDGEVKTSGKLKFIREPKSVQFDQKGNIVSTTTLSNGGLARLATPEPNPSVLPSQYCHPNPDCGVHALYYLLKLRRIECTQEDVANRLPLNEGTGASMLDMRNTSFTFGCPTEVVQFSVSDAMVHVPFIARLKGKTDSNGNINNDGHYVVVTSINGRNVTMIDGSGAGFISSSQEVFEKNFSGYALIVPKPWWKAAWIKTTLLTILFVELLLILIYFFIKKIYPQIHSSNAQTYPQGT